MYWNCSEVVVIGLAVQMMRRVIGGGLFCLHGYLVARVLKLVLKVIKKFLTKKEKRKLHESKELKLIVCGLLSDWIA